MKSRRSLLKNALGLSVLAAFGCGAPPSLSPLAAPPTSEPPGNTGTSKPYLWVLREFSYGNVPTDERAGETVVGGRLLLVAKNGPIRLRSLTLSFADSLGPAQVTSLTLNLLNKPIAPPVDGLVARQAVFKLSPMPLQVEQDDVQIIEIGYTLGRVIGNIMRADIVRPEDIYAEDALTGERVEVRLGGNEKNLSLMPVRISKGQLIIKNDRFFTAEGVPAGTANSVELAGIEAEAFGENFTLGEFLLELKIASLDWRSNAISNLRVLRINTNETIGTPIPIISYFDEKSSSYNAYMPGYRFKDGDTCYLSIIADLASDARGARITPVFWATSWTGERSGPNPDKTYLHVESRPMTVY